MDMVSWIRGMRKPTPRKSQRTVLTVESLDERLLPSVGLAFVGLAKAPPEEMSYLAGQLKKRTGEVEVSFLPFEFNPTNPFGNATKLAQETLPEIKGKLRLSVDLKWFVHDSGKNGLLEDGAAADVYGRPAQRAFWKAWETYDASVPQQPQPIVDYLNRVSQANAWVAQIRKWATDNKVQNKLGITFVPVLEDEFSTKKAYSKLVNAIKAQQVASSMSPTKFRRSPNGSNSEDFRVSDVSMEWHGKWPQVKNKLQKGDTWSNDGTSYGITSFVTDGRSAKKNGVSALYWNSDMNGTPKYATNWAARTVNPFSGPSKEENKARLKQVLGI